MPLPVASCADDVSTDACCTTLFDVADRIRRVAYNAVCDCLDPDCADQDFRSFVSVGPTIEDPIGDSLIVHMPRIIPTANSTTAQGALLGVAVHLADFEVRLLEKGWPVIEMNELEEIIAVPDPAYVNAISRHVYSHGERMYRALVDQIQFKTLITVPLGFVGTVQISGLDPIQPSGTLAGWTTTVRAQLTFPPFIMGS